MIGDILFEVVGQMICYPTGRAIAAVATPHIKASLSVSEPVGRAKRRAFALTFVRDGTRYYYQDTLTLLGLLFWMAVGTAILMVRHSAK